MSESAPRGDFSQREYQMWLVFAAVGIIAALVAGECVREVRTFRVTRYEVRSGKLRGVKPRKAALLSDLHDCEYGKGNIKLLKTLAEEKPDIILISGDMFIEKKRTGRDNHASSADDTKTGCGVRPVKAVNFVKALTKIAPVYYANGNHEQHVKENTRDFGDTYERYKSELEAAGVIYLENDFANLSWEGRSVRVFGLELPASYYKACRKDSDILEYMKKHLPAADPASFNILIAHNPAHMYGYARWGADLIVSGHLHGGVVRIPRFRGVISPQGKLFPKFSGEMTKIGDSFGIVSKGIGEHTIKLRFLNQAEVVMITVAGDEK